MSQPRCATSSLLHRLPPHSSRRVSCAVPSCMSLGRQCDRAAQDWDAIAKKDNLNEMSMELRRLEAMVKEIHEEMLFLRTREEEMRDLNGEPRRVFVRGIVARQLRVSCSEQMCAPSAHLKEDIVRPNALRV